MSQKEISFMLITIVQSFPKYADTASNLDFIHRTIDTVETDLLVFPELATSGYFFTDKSQILPHALTWNESIELKDIKSISFLSREIQDSSVCMMSKMIVRLAS